MTSFCKVSSIFSKPWSDPSTDDMETFINYLKFSQNFLQFLYHTESPKPLPLSVREMHDSLKNILWAYFFKIKKLFNMFGATGHGPPFQFQYRKI